MRLVCAQHMHHYNVVGWEVRKERWDALSNVRLDRSARRNFDQPPHVSFSRGLMIMPGLCDATRQLIDSINIEVEERKYLFDNSRQGSPLKRDSCVPLRSQGLFHGMLKLGFARVGI
jgi:hypothetical protein